WTVRQLRWPRCGALAVAQALLLALAAPSGAASESGLETLARTAEELCLSADPGSDAAADRLQAALIEEEVFGPQGMPVRVQRRFRQEAGSDYVVITDRPGGVLRRLVLEHHVAGGSRPEAMVVLDGACALQHARRIEYGRSGMAETLALFASTPEPHGRQALTPPPPDA